MHGSFFLLSFVCSSRGVCIFVVEGCENNCLYPFATGIPMEAMCSIVVSLQKYKGGL